MLHPLTRRLLATARDTNAQFSPIDIEATDNFLRGLDASGLLAKFRHLNLLLGNDPSQALQMNVMPVRDQWVFLNSFPSISYTRIKGMQADTSGTFIPTAFNAATASLTYSNWTRGVYVIDPGPNRSGVLLGVGENQNGNANVLSNQDGMSILGGYKFQHTRSPGLMTITGDPTEIRTMGRYLVEDSQPTGLDPIGTFDAESTLLSNWDGGYGSESDATIGAVFESQALTREETCIVSGLLDRFNFELGRTKAASILFFGGETIPANDPNSWPRQMAGAIGLPVIDATIGQGAFEDFPDFPAPMQPSGYSRFQFDMIDVPSAFKAILYGTRDVLLGDPYTPQGFKRLLQAMIDTMLEAGILAQNIVLGTPPDITDQALTDHGVDRSRLEAYVRACFEVAATTKVRLVDCYEATRGQPELFVSNYSFDFDGIALNNAGHQVLSGLFVRAFSTSVVEGGATVVPASLTGSPAASS